MKKFINSVRLHIYGKSETRESLKTGHIIATSKTVEQAAENAGKRMGS